MQLPLVVSAILAFASAMIIPCTDRRDDMNADERFGKARSRVKQLIKDRTIASFQVALARNGQILYEEGFGYADVKRDIPTTVNTMHLVASIAKPFTSTVLMILCERGQIGLHEPVNKYLRRGQLVAFRGDAADATIARLLLHTTGLPYGYYIAGPQVGPQDKRSNEELLALAGVLVCAPGTRYQYTNIGYGLFEDIVRSVTGQNMKAFIMHEVITPLRLRHTRFFQGAVPADSAATQNGADGPLPVVYDSDGYTALYSTAGDLVRFGMFHLKAHLADQEPILADSSIDALWQYSDPAERISTRRLGWDVQHDYGFLTIQHGGGGPGLHNWLYLIPSEGIVIALMSNAQYGSSDMVLKELIAAAVPQSAGSAFRPGAGRGWPRWPQPEAAVCSGEWSGQIRGPKGACSLVVKFDWRGNPKLRLIGDSDSANLWVKASGRVKKSYGTLLWRFPASIPYLLPFAVHDEVILTVWQEEGKLIGSASAAKEKNFGPGENYVLPQFVELKRSP